MIMHEVTPLPEYAHQRSNVLDLLIVEHVVIVRPVRPHAAVHAPCELAANPRRASHTINVCFKLFARPALPFAPAIAGWLHYAPRLCPATYKWAFPLIGSFAH